jgi:lysozyme
MNIDKMIQELVRDEGIRLKPYRDTVGKLTIGIGRNLDDVGIMTSEAYYLCQNDITSVVDTLNLQLPWWKSLDEVRQRVIVNMVFNMGIGRFFTFINTIDLIKEGKYTDAAANMLLSKWAGQVGPRAIRLSEMMRIGGNE